MIFQDLRHETVHPTTNRGQKHQDIRAFIPFGNRSLDCSNLPVQTPNPREQLLLFF